MNDGIQAAPTAISLYAAAKGYLQAAKMIFQSPHRSGPNVQAVFLPLHLLLGFSLELYFKSWLLQAGHSSEELKRVFGHDLKKLFAATQEARLPAIDRLAEVVEHFHGPHSRFEYRYLAPETVYGDTNIGLSLAALDTLDHAIDAATGASASVGKLPGH